MAKKSAISVDLFLKELKHPQKKEIELLRKIILSTDKKLTEQIKWNAPSFCYNGDDRITFNLTGKGFIRIIFHCGAKVKDNKSKTRLFDDKTGLFEWAANDRTIVTFSDLEEIKAKEKHLKEVIKSWLSITK